MARINIAMYMFYGYNYKSAPPSDIIHFFAQYKKKVEYKIF